MKIYYLDTTTQELIPASHFEKLVECGCTRGIVYFGEYRNLELAKLDLKRNRNNMLYRYSY